MTDPFEISKKREFPVQPFKDKIFCRNYFTMMVRARALEERLIKMVRVGDGFFWIGGPGEEAFNIALGLQADRGHGLAHDMLHLHYRSNAVVLAMGAPMVDFIRQMRSVGTDPFSGGRNFSSHIARKEWNVMPVTSTIETQFSVAPGTALAQKRVRDRGEKSGVTIVIGGEAGTAEGDFATCLIWSSRPEKELPILMICTNNGFGISTPAATQHGEKNVSDRGKAFGIRTHIIDGNTPEKAWAGISDALEYVRDTGLPYLLEVKVSRLNGHSSSSGANRVNGEEDCIEIFEKKLIRQGFLTEDEAKKIYESASAEASAAYEQVRQESYPDSSTVLDHSFANGVRAGLPGRDHNG